MSKHFYTWFTCCLFALLTVLPASAQDSFTLNGNLDEELTPGESYTFYDSGGANGNYSTSESYTATFTNNGPITINFSSLVTESSSNCNNWDYMLLYDGTASNGTLIGRGQTGCSSATITTNQDYTASSGTLTVEWHSDSSTPAAGWVATITAGGTLSGCPKPGKIELGEVTANSASFSWTASSDNETSWTVTVKNGDDVLVDNETVTTPAYTLTGLNPSSDYTLSVEVTHSCTDDNSVRIASLSVSTLCGAISDLPWTETFENMAKGSSSSEAPRCWALAKANDGTYPYIFVNTSASYVHSGSKSLYFQSSNTRSGFIILPEFTDDALADAELDFYYKHESATASGMPAVGYMTNIADTSTFVALEVFPLSTAWVKVEVELGTIPSGARLAIRYGQATTQNYYMGIDDITVRKLPSCRRVRKAWVEDITTTSAKLVWTSTPASDYYVELKSGDITLPINVSGGDTSYVVNGLTSGSLYEGVQVSIITLCGATDSSEVYNAVLPAFTTACEIVEFEEDTLRLGFEEYAAKAINLVPCWDSLCPAGGFSSTSFKWSVSSTYAHSGSKSMYMYGMSSNVKSSVLVSPAINLPENYEFVVYAREGTTHSDKDSLIFYINDAPTLAGATRLGKLVPSTSWEEFRKKLAGFRDEIYILVDAYAYNSIYLDDFTFRPAPSCLPVGSARLDSIGSHAVKLTWTAGGEETMWSVDYYFNESDPSESGYIVEGTPELLIEELESNVSDTLFVSIIAICGEGNESEEIYEGAFGFQTPAEPTEVPYASGFEDEEDNAKWSFANASTNQWVIGEAAHHGANSTQALYISNNEGASYHYSHSAQFSWAYRPFTFDDPDAEYKIAFDWKGYGESSWDGMIVMLVPDNVMPQAAASTSSQVGDLSVSRSTTPETAAEHGYLLFENNLKGSIFFNEQAGWQTASLTARVARAGSYNLCFGWMNDGSGGTDSISAIVDNLFISKKACKDVSDLYIHYVGADTIILSWLPTHNEYSIKVWDEINDSTLVELGSKTATADTFIVLSGLTPATEYYLYAEICGLCDGGISGDTLKVGGLVLTECVPLAAPYVMDFEDQATGSGNLPICWSYVRSNDTYPYVYNYSTYAYEGSKSMYWYGGTSSSERCIVLPEMADALSSLRLRFMYRATSSTYTDASYPSLIVGVMTDPSDITTFLPLDTLAKTATYTQYEKLLSSVSEEYHFLAIRYSGGTSSGYTVIDNVIVDEIPSCFGASNLSVVDSLATMNSVTFSWISDAASFKVLYKQASDSIYTSVVVNEPKLTIDGLQNSSNYLYDLQVVAVCSATDEARDTLAATLSAATSCEIVTAFPWVENFDSYEAGDIDFACWNNEHTAGSSTYIFQVSTGEMGANSTPMLKYPDMASGNSARLDLPEMNIPAANAYEFALDVYRFASSSYGGASYYEEGLFVMNGEDTLAFIPRVPASTAGINVPVENEDGWYTYTFTLANAGVQRISLVGRSKYGSATYADNLRVREIPSCMPASNLRALPDSSTTTSVAFAWTPNSDETSWRVVVKNGETELANEVVADTIYTVTGLNPSTTYSLAVQVYVRCGEIESYAHERTLNFATECAPIATLPWTESFESMPTGSNTSAAPLCWALLNANQGTYPYIYISSSSTYVRTGSRCLFFSNNYEQAGYAILPEFEDLSNAMITFSYKDENVNYSGPLEVGYLTDITDETTFVSLASFERSTTWVDEATAYLNTVPAGARVAFRYGASPASSSYYYLGIDDIVVKAQPSCRKPSDVTVGEVTSTSAAFSWTGNADNYSVVVYNGLTKLDSVVVAADALPFVIDTLSPNTSYAFRFEVMGMCGAEDGNSEVRSTILSVHTPCSMLGAEELPFTENFDGMSVGYSTYTLPDCWSRIFNSSYPYVYNSYSYSHSGSNVLYFYGGGSNVRYAVLPGIEAPLSGLQLSFWYMHPSSYTGSSYGSLTVGVMSNPNDTATFVAIETLSQVTSYEQVEIMLASAPADCHYIALRYAGGTSSYGYVYVDDIEVSVAPSCMKVKNITKSAVSFNEATFTWESNGNEAAWNVVVTDLGNENAELINTTVNSRAISVNTLTANTAYTLRVSVSAVCGESETSEAASKDFTFRTAPSPDMTTAIAADSTLVADFSDAAERGKWVVYGDEETNHFIFGTNAAALVGSATHGLYISNDNSSWHYTSTAAGSIVFRQFSVEEANTRLTVHFQWQAKGESTWDYARAFIVSESTELSVFNHNPLIAGTTMNNNMANAEFTGVVRNITDDTYTKLNLVESWQTMEDSLIVLPTAGTYRLVFAWRNDGSSDYQYPLAVGDVQIINRGVDPASAIDPLYNGEKKEVVKFIRNGQVYIQVDGVVYNILGTTVR